ncbi:hypothetical protein RJT34_16776 [Clitoria ternatea]|uniref:Uncharacterized protein n=1 Tax=Clitoria ternatea TaxID=43366 RepID=A0AAN9PDZ0_CLITE
MIERANIEGSKSNVAMNAWLPQASYPCDVSCQPNFPPDNVFHLDRPTKVSLRSKKRGNAPPPIHGISYGSILPTSLAYIVPLARGCSPWRPDAVMSTTRRGRHSVLQIFKGRQGRTGLHTTCGALPAAEPYLWLSRFQGGQAVQQKR